MNAVEIEEAISALAEQPFDGNEFPYLFLQAFGNKETTIKRLRAGASNKSDLDGILQTNNIHIAIAAPNEVTKTLAALKASPATAKAKARFILSTDGADFEAEDLDTGETVACAYTDFPDHFGFFLPLAGISTIKQVRESSFDIRATSRLNRLYVQLLKDNPEWSTAARRHDMNHFMARLIFCFFAEDKRDKVAAALKDPAQKNNRDYVDIIIALGMAKEGFDWIWCEHALTVGYAILAKTMSEDSLKQVAAAIAAKRTSLTPEEAKELAVRAVKFKKERGRLPSIDSQDAWERRMAEGAAAFVRFKDEGRYE